MVEVLKNLLNAYSDVFRLAYTGYSYKQLRNIFPSYNSQIIANAIYNTRYLRKSVLKIHSYPKKFEQNLFLRKQDYRIEGNKVSIIYKPRNRLVLNVFPTGKQLEKMREGRVKGARLVEKEGNFFLNVVVEKEVKLSLEECKTIIGVDIGINYLAVCSAFDGKKFGNPLFFKGGEWKHLCRRQKKSSPEKWKHLTNRKNEILHTVAKRIVEYAKRFEKPCIVMENLRRMRSGKTYNKWNNFLLSFWARRKLQKLIEYKAKWEGIPVVYVNSAYTSVICHRCGLKGKREGSVFKCLNCGKEYDSDANASMNVAKRFRQLLDELKAMTGKRSLLDLSSSEEGKTYLPRQAYIQPGNGKQMNGMIATWTASLPLGVGGD
jgi:putative transposase